MCGLTGIVSIRRDVGGHADMTVLREMVSRIEERQFHHTDDLLRRVRELKDDTPFFEIFTNKAIQDELLRLTSRLTVMIDKESKALAERMGRLDTEETKAVSGNIEKLKDAAWCLNVEIGENISKIRDLLYRAKASPEVVTIFKRINAVLNSIDRLEVRGRDSAGISLMFVLDKAEFEKFTETLNKANFSDQLKERTERDILLNMGISIHETSPRLSGEGQGERWVSAAFTYKVAAEIGCLGDNIRFLRQQIKNDVILQAIVNFAHRNHTVLSHTRWASVGAISEANCHPVDNDAENIGMIHVCLNGDIDNYAELKAHYEQHGKLIHKDVSTDTKIIPLQIEKYIREGKDAVEAFRLALNDFDGSHAIAMHTDLAPGKLFLAQKGSGQAIFVGLADRHYMAASEVYGFIEETSQYLKLDGEKTVEGKHGKTQGQIVILDQQASGGPDGIRAMYYDGTPITFTDQDIRYTEIMSRDIDRQGYPHYFLKEISEAPASVEKTLLNRWKITDEKQPRYLITLDETVVPESVRKAFSQNQIRRVFFIGQGTAGVAAQACADIFTSYMNDPTLPVCSLKASELSGFRLQEDGGPDSMSDTLVVAITQSGTTTDTNRAVDMVRERGAHTLAIVNRRDSHITFKVDGVMYTSSGRDIEMSVASTKAFYSQIVAGAVLSLFLAKLRDRRDDEFIEKEIRQLLEIPGYMRRILSMREAIELSAKRIAITRTYWAVVGSGPNKTSSDEIRIKLSELCYKTISSDYVEDKKHIDLSSEPLIIVCAGGSRPAVLNDIIKDVAIFRAHKALPVVIADDGEHRFDAYAEDVFHVPPVSEHLAPIVNTLVGHIWGYYAALAINDGSRFLYQFREDVQKALDEYAKQGLNIYEVILEKSFREKMALFYTEFRRKMAENKLPITMNVNAVSDLILLLKYLSGRLPVSDFELDFGIRGTARNMLDALFVFLGKSVNDMARPVDAIKHQAKTVTVGTSRISEKMEGMLFEILRVNKFKVSQLTTTNVIVLRNLQDIVSGILGTTVYRVDGLNFLGEPNDDSTIRVVRREGSSLDMASRVEKDARLKGSKRIIVRQGNVYIGKGRKDDRSILCIPVISDSSERPNIIEHLVLLHIAFKDYVALGAKIKALGGKYEHIKNIVQENTISWNDSHLELVEISELFGRSAEKVGEYIVSRLR